MRTNRISFAWGASFDVLGTFPAISIEHFSFGVSFLGAVCPTSRSFSRRPDEIFQNFLKIPREKHPRSPHSKGEDQGRSVGLTPCKRIKMESKKRKDPGKSCEHIILDSELHELLVRNPRFFSVLDRFAGRNYPRFLRIRNH